MAAIASVCGLIAAQPRSARQRLRYSRVVTGTNTAASPAATASETTIAVPSGEPAISDRDAVASTEIGLTSTKACSGPGSVAGSTKTLDRNVSGRSP